MKSLFKSLRPSTHAPSEAAPPAYQFQDTPTTSQPLPSNVNNPTTPLTVVELFQSQSCSSCPSTNANLISLAQSPPANSNILYLNYHVTYWNHLSWTDTFSQPQFDQRQRQYVHALGLRSAFTPQVIVNGRASGVGSRSPDLERILDQGRATLPIAISLVSNPDQSSNEMTISLDTTRLSSAHHHNNLEANLVLYDPAPHTVKITSGENRGRTLPHINVVRGVRKVGDVRAGETQTLTVAEQMLGRAKGLKGVLLVQDGPGGPIFGAVQL